MKVLDASVLIRFLNKETGWENILEILEGKIAVSSLNIAEFYTWWVRKGGKVREAEEIVSDMEIEIIDFDKTLAKQTAEIYPKTKQFGLSMGDRACLCTANQLKSKVFTCDRIWKEAQLDGFEVEVV